jgi:hypothetical protein
MNSSPVNRLSPLGLFPGQPRLYERAVGARRNPYCSRHTKEAYRHGFDPSS